jgi:hypothetical protein
VRHKEGATRTNVAWTWNEEKKRKEQPGRMLHGLGMEKKKRKEHIAWTWNGKKREKSQN